jgi:hypothetical protein
MIEPRIIPFHPEHLFAFMNRDKWNQEDYRLAVEREQRGPAYTAVVGETVLACAGVMVVWPGVGSAWMAWSEDAARYPIWLTKAVRRLVQETAMIFGLHRIECVVLADNERNQRWIARMGFTMEQGKARAYTPDKRDVIRYERMC